MMDLKGGFMKYITPCLKTERLILKRGTLEDYVKVYEYDFTYLRNINGEFKYVKFDPKRLQEYVTYADETEFAMDFIVYLKDNNEPIGNIVVDLYNKEFNSLEISCNLHPTYWHKGYMTEAIIEIMRYIFDNLDIDNIIYGYAEKNYKSKGLSDKLGFEFLKEYKMHYKRIDKDVQEIETIMSKKRFRELYSSKTQNTL